MIYSDFDPKPVFRSYKRLIGDGEVGGKARGLAFAFNAIEGSSLASCVELPDINFVLTTEGFSEFVSDNGIEELLRESLAGNEENSDEDFAHAFYEKITSAFQRGTIRTSLIDDLQKAMETIGDLPLAIRSSSILEDSKNYPCGKI